MSGPRGKQSGNQGKVVVKEPGVGQKQPSEFLDAGDPKKNGANATDAAVELAVKKPQNPGRHADSFRGTDIERDEVDPEMEEKMAKYVRGKPIRVQKFSSRLRVRMEHREQVFGAAVLSAAQAEKWLHPSEAGSLAASEPTERTRNFQQRDIAAQLGTAGQRAAFDVKLDALGPYVCSYSLNGRSLLLGGHKGHLAVVDWRRLKIITEMQVRETVHDVCFLHNELFFAAAQKKYTYIYDKRGIELHCLKNITGSGALRLSFLPLHFLLVSVGKSPSLHYVDVTTGAHVASLSTKRGRCSSLCHDPRTGVVALGHATGTVSLWTPNMATPIASILCHHSPVTAVAHDRGGNYFATAGMDGRVRVWDARKLQETHSYLSPAPARTIALSQRDLLAVGYGSGVEIWKDALATKQMAPYMKHRMAGGSAVERLAFCPFEDVLAVGHEQGLSSLVVPGAGEPNFDSFVANPFETARQRQESEVHALLDKLPAESIMREPERIGTLARGHEREVEKRQGAAEAANRGMVAQEVAELRERRKTKGRSSSSKRHKRKQSNVITEQRERIAKKARVGGEEGQRKGKGSGGETVKDVNVKKAGNVPVALARFKK